MLSTAGFTAANIFFTPLTPHIVILAVLLTAGFRARCIFTSANALVFATLDDKQTSQATAISATIQQISIALGVAVAGGVLELSGALTGQATSIESFHVAF